MQVSYLAVALISTNISADANQAVFGEYTHRHGDGAQTEPARWCNVSNLTLSDYSYKVGVGWLSEMEVLCQMCITDHLYPHYYLQSPRDHVLHAN